MGKRLQAHNIRIRTFIHATEDPEKVLEALETLFPEDISAKDIDFEVIETEGYFGNPILVVDAELRHSRNIRKFLENLRKMLSEEDRRYLWEHAEEKVDDTGTFYIRFDKQKAYLGEAKVSEGEDVIHVRIKVKAFPMKKESVVKAVREWLEGEE
ncbi:hypothetical protein A3L04_00115 [Thermococcus chitonophagus]|uniref:Uncharacterized protein MJ0213 n=1 Tax=Thermococcus chitonophagus TaxID=54262 RepID=A0A160VPU1_9EURY|nr:RNA-binding protein [Thermococcus chitonophagus]ASJ15590.1 hypothetical protein A3L04_00115 [Thermococcus chitonophagus]CUX76797.1 Uncharacterized protein MJ0213 [Thermococcus chitonophagus]